ncbi:damage-control phosphatase ARMT1-like [Saccoglossus kowalevskii]|uniref:Sugar phosphate phosphatase n=1 Tax=Saccoglossus kowalevskii TaxID=10224 RepID=A0ABM0GN37_SACKO|nr:PREDICTED: UPF0364 protein C6orf211 homolog [Saccoglossus kowalevskii]
MAEKVDEMPEPLSAKYVDQFAYPTVKDRLPVILTKVIDTVYQYKNTAAEQHGEAGKEDCKFIVSKLSELKNAIQTDKPLTVLADGRGDVSIWNKAIQKEIDDHGNKHPSWFKSPWLLTECYMYRKINESIRMSSKLQEFDPFGEQKRSALKNSHDACIVLANYIHDITKDNKDVTYEQFSKILQIALWGNKCDLSISAGVENSQNVSPLLYLNEMASNILVDSTQQVWQALLEARKNGKQTRVDIILDNMGFELFSDLCFAEFLLRTSLAHSIHLHYKVMPWFVSDVTREDFLWTLQTLKDSPNEVLSKLSETWQNRLQDESWVIKGDDFWTTACDFRQMKSKAPHLYDDLTSSSMCFFKGDLNYRKLVGDLNWNHTTPYELTLGGFHPSPHCALRTIKCDLVVGLQEGRAEEITKLNADWMLGGDYGVIHFCDLIEK